MDAPMPQTVEGNREQLLGEEPTLLRDRVKA